MMPPVVFLDIDGVLHIAGDRPRTLNQKCVRALNWLTEATKARIVISSTWRRMPNIRVLLAEQGVEAKIVGLTPVAPTGNRTWTRGTEIAAWLEGHASRRFVILDDDSDMGPRLRAFLVQTGQEGLTLPLAELAVTVLTRRRDP